MLNVDDGGCDDDDALLMMTIVKNAGQDDVVRERWRSGQVCTRACV